MAEKLGIERESVYRLEAKADGVAAGKQKSYAAALGIRPEDLWRKPDDPLLDSLVADAPEDIRESVRSIVKRLTEKKDT